MAASVKADTISGMKNEAKAICDTCSEYLKKSAGDEFLLRSHHACKSLLACEEGDRNGISQWLLSYAKIVLDVTFYKENVLVETDFMNADAESELSLILSTLDKPEICANRWLGKNIKVSEILGDEVYECIQWRKGALCYMYCCTLAQDEEQRKKKHQSFIKYCHNGVKYLQAMMAVRSPLTVPETQVVTNDKDSFNLLSQGLFSDTHVLALMYGGELCSWYHKWSTSEDQVQYNWKDFKETGEMFIKCYINACNGPLKGKGWSTEQAEDLLKSLHSVKPS